MNQHNNLETYSIVWLNSKVNEVDDENVEIKQQLRAIINRLDVFNNVEDCQNYFKNISNNDRVVVITDCQDIVTSISSLRQLSSIYIYNSKDDDSKVLNLSKKIKAVSNTLDEIIIKIRYDFSDMTARRYQEVEDSLSIDIFNIDSITNLSSTELNGRFMFSKLLLDNLLLIPWNEVDKNEMFSICEKEYSGNPVSLMTLYEFKRTYSSQHALFWYTKESFLYRLLNKALRTQNIDLLYLFRFFIYDAYEQLKQHQCASPIRVYRGQLISKEELNTLQNAQGQLISINSFLSTSMNRDMAIFYLGEYILSDESQQILFEINADPLSDNKKPFANIASLSSFPNEEEVLMMAGSIFRLESIAEQYENKINRSIHIIRMTLCNNDDHISNPIYETIKSKVYVEDKETSCLQFAKLLIYMGKFHEAEKYFRRLLDQYPNDSLNTAHCYYGLGLIANGKGEHVISLQFLHQALEIRIKKLPADHEDISWNYNGLGIAYEEKGDYEFALEAYEKAIVHGENQPRFANCLNNIAVVYQRLKMYDKALEYHKRAYLNWSENLPADYPNIAASLHNMGDVYSSCGEYETALEHYQRALSMFRKSLHSQHPHIAYILGSIGLVYENTSQFEDAMVYLQKSIQIYETIVLPVHPGRARVQQGLSRVIEKMQLEE